MSGGAVATTLGFAAILLCIVAIIDWHRIQIAREEEGLAPSGPVLRVQWPPLASCAWPARPLTVDQAHQAMQIHRECDIDTCGCKWTAQTVLVEAGHLRPRVEYR